MDKAIEVLSVDFAEDEALQHLVRVAAPVARSEAEEVAALHGGALSNRAMEAISQGTRAEALARGGAGDPASTVGVAGSQGQGQEGSAEAAVAVDDAEDLITRAMGYDHRGHVVSEMDEGFADFALRGGAADAHDAWSQRRMMQRRVFKLAGLLAAVTERLERLGLAMAAAKRKAASGSQGGIGAASGAGADVPCAGPDAAQSKALASLKTPFTKGRPAFLALLRSCVSKATSSVAVKRAALQTFYALLCSPVAVSRGELAALATPVVVDAAADGASSLDEPIMRCLLAAASPSRLGPSAVLRIASTGIDGAVVTRAGRRQLGSLGAQPPNRQYRSIEFCRVLLERASGRSIQPAVRRRLVEALVAALQSRSAAVRDLAAGCLSEALDLSETEGDDVELAKLMRGVDLLKAASLAGKAPASMRGHEAIGGMGGARYEGAEGESPFLGRNAMPRSVRAAGLSVAKLGKVAEGVAQATLGVPRLPSLRRLAERRLQELLMSSGDGTAGMSGTGEVADV